MNIFPILETAATVETATETGGAMSLITTILPMVLIFGLMYLLMIRPQRKKEKEAQERRANLQIGDEIVTNGGIVGRVTKLEDDTIVIETGGDRSKLRLLRAAIATINVEEEESSTKTSKKDDKESKKALSEETEDHDLEPED